MRFYARHTEDRLDSARGIVNAFIFGLACDIAIVLLVVILMNL